MSENISSGTGRNIFDNQLPFNKENPWENSSSALKIISEIVIVVRYAVTKFMLKFWSMFWKDTVNQHFTATLFTLSFVFYLPKWEGSP